MSFFISDSLKGVISEKDLEAESPIKLIEENEKIFIRINSEEDVFECELISINFNKKRDEIKVLTDKHNLINIFNIENKQVMYSIILNEKQHMQNSGIVYIDKLEVNKEDNYSVCKIDICKRGY